MIRTGQRHQSWDAPAAVETEVETAKASEDIAATVAAVEAAA